MTESLTLGAEAELARLKKKELRSWIGRVLWWSFVLASVILLGRVLDLRAIASGSLVGLLPVLAGFSVLVLGSRYLLVWIAPSIMWTWEDQRRLDTARKTLAEARAQ